MCALLDNSAVVQYQYAIGIDNGRQTVRNHQARMVLGNLPQRSQD